MLEFGIHLFQFRFHVKMDKSSTKRTELRRREAVKFRSSKGDVLHL